MMKRILSLMLCMMCIVCIKAQDTPPSGWTDDPTGNYEKETVVYVTVEDDNQSRGILSRRGGSQIAAFVDGTVRDVVDVSNYLSGNTPDGTSFKVYTFRVGGNATVDTGKEITFQVYDAGQGIIYPLTSVREDGSNLELKWAGGDASLNQPSTAYDYSYHSISGVGLIYNVDMLDLKPGESLQMTDFVRIEYYSDTDEVPTIPLTPVTWSWSPSEDNPGNVVIVGDQITATEIGNGEIGCKVGDVEGGNSIWVTIYNPLTSLAIENMTLYKGNRIPGFPVITFNGGESTPTYPNVYYEFEEGKLEVVGEDENGNPALIAGPEAAIGDVIEVTAFAANQPGTDEDVVTTTFNITIASALLSYTPVKEEVDVWLWDGDMDLSNLVPSPTPEMMETSDEFEFDYEMNDPYGYTVVSDNPEVVDYNSDHILVAKSKGVAHVTFANEYDPTKTATVTVNVKQTPLGVAITSVNGIEIPEASPTMPVVEVAIGQTATAIANVTPLNADFDEFTIEFVDANHGPIGNVIEDMSWIEYNSTEENGVFTLTFTANRLPVPADQEIYLKAIVTNDNMDDIESSLVRVVFVKKVAEIVVPESKTVWVNQLPSQDIKVDIVPEIYPVDATNKDLEITFDTEGFFFVMSDRNLMPLKKGTAKVTYTSVDNPSVTATCEVTIKVRVSSLEVTGDLELYSDGQPTNLEVAYSPENADFDPDYLTLSVNEDRTIPSLPDGWSPVEFINANLYGRAICETYLLEVSYDQGACEGLDAGINTINLSLEGSVKEKIDVTDGWNWISLTSGPAYIEEITNEDGNALLVEARSQTELVYNDPVFGFFGDLYEMVPGQAYKLDAEMGGTIFVDFFSNDYSPLYENSAFDQNINPRWNWVGYPYEYEYWLSDAYDATQLAEGDMVITKGGDMAIIKDGEWTNDFSVKPNTGMMLYHNGEAETSLPMKARGAFEQGTWSISAEEAKSRKESVWQYDGSRFPNMMAVVGQLNIDSADDYTIGAFVGDECRGAGKIVDGLVLVSLAGKAGEKVTFRLHNEWTGEFIEVDNVLNFSDLAGSLKNPVMLNVPEDATAIDNVSTEGISINGNVLNFGTYKGTATVTSIDGKVVAKTTESSISVDELPAGIYVVVIEGGAKPIVKKIVKE